MASKILPSKTVALFAILICFVFSASAQKTAAPEHKAPRVIFKVSPFQRASDTYEIGVEYFNKARSRSLQLSPGYRSHSTEYETSKGFSLELAHRGYFKVSPLKGDQQYKFFRGVYYSVFAIGSYFEGSRDNTMMVIYPDGTRKFFPSERNDKITALTPGLSIGLQKRFLKVMFLDVNIGAGYRFIRYYIDPDAWTFDLDNDNPFKAVAYRGIFPKLEAKLGIGL
jgi:hypothetical protein